jgi:hypothetical protein
VKGLQHMGEANYNPGVSLIDIVMLNLPGNIKLPTSGPGMSIRRGLPDTAAKGIDNSAMRIKVVPRVLSSLAGEPFSIT